MFETLKRGLAKIVVFALLSVLILSFAVWGIGDIIRRGVQGPIATVGRTEISAREFTSALQNRRQALQQRLGEALTPEKSRNYGIDESVLAELINGAAISNHADALGVHLSDRVVAEQIRTDPSFQGADNKFDRAVFGERIRQAGFTEQSYFAERRANEARQQIAEALVLGQGVSDTMVAEAWRFREETRSVAIVKLDPAKLPKPAEPDDKALMTFYEESKQTYSVPERRDVAVLILANEDLAKRSEVADAEVRAAWEQNRQSWDLPERRRIQQILYKTKLEAEGEAKALRDGKNFLMAALEANGARGRVDQGLIARREISDANFAKTAFELAINTVSEPIQVRAGWVVMRISEIEAGRERSYDEVKAEVRQSLEETKRQQIAGKLHDEIEDKRGASAETEKLKAIGAAMNLKIVEARDIDATGRKPDGTPGLVVPDAERILASAFEGDKALPREVVQLQGGGEAWIEVVGVTPQKIKPFDEVKAEVAKRWHMRETSRALIKQGQALVGRIKAGETIETVAKEIGAKVETTAAFKRSEPPAELSPGAARIAFTLPKGAAGSGALAAAGSRGVFVVTQIKAPDAPSKEASAAIKAELLTEMQRDAMQTYVAALRNRQGVSVNEAVYKRAVGLDQVQ